jgi:L-amino acid N-acyltransferase YncA
MRIIVMDPGHWADVKRIYQQGIDTYQATFEESPPVSWEKWSKKFLPGLSLVCLDGDQMLGWAAISRVSSRQVYQGVGEISLYVDLEFQGQGIGKKLLERIITESERAGFWTLQASIFPENIVSIQLHQACGFRIVGKREKIAKMTYGPQAGQWRDVFFLERRSKIANDG